MHFPRSSFVPAILVLIIVFACTPRDLPPPASEVQASQEPKKTASLYEEQDRWPGACLRSTAVDQRQSPIALTDVQFKASKSSSLSFQYQAADVEVIDNGHTLLYRFKGNAGRLVFEGQSYDLKQFHFHRASEHTLNGKSFAMEVHFVHLAAPGSAKSGAVALGFFLDPGAPSPAWKNIWAGLSPKGSEHQKADQHSEKVLTQLTKLDPRALVPKGARYYAYEGSLTTPNCDEFVTHLVSVQPIPLDQASIDLFASYHPLSNRQLQPDGDPKVRKFRLAMEK